jgi:membrane protein implicated in regulation of membrane protease activity
MSTVDSNDVGVVLLIAVSALLFGLYSVLIQGSVRWWIASLLPFAFVYLFWRFVRAVERIADAYERETARNGGE